MLQNTVCCDIFLGGGLPPKTAAALSDRGLPLYYQSSCELPRYSHSLLTAAVIPVSVNCRGATSLCKLQRKCQSL